MNTPSYSPVDPNNPMIFNRVPYEKRLHWLWLWNPNNDPHHINCTVAVDTLAYFANQHTQSQQSYYHGVYGGIKNAKHGLDKCIEVRALASSDYDAAKVCYYD